MMSLTMMGLTSGLLLRSLFLFASKNLLVVLTTSLVMLTTPLVVLTIPLVVFVAWVLEFLFRQESSQLVKFFRWLCPYQ